MGLSPQNVATLGYLIEQLTLHESDLDQATKLESRASALIRAEDVERVIRQKYRSDRARMRGTEHRERLDSIAGFDRLQVYCEAEWGEDLTLKNAKRIRGIVRKQGRSLAEANSTSLVDAANIVSGESRNVIASRDSESRSKWSAARSPSEWRKVFDVSWRTLKRRMDAGTLRFQKISSKSYRFHVDDLPSAS